MRRQFHLALPILLFALVPAFAAPPPAARVVQKLYITNTQGDDITVVDVATNKNLGSIKVGPQPHGLVVTAAQDMIYASIEAKDPGEIVYIDPVTDTVVKRILVGPRPNQLAVTPDGKFLYVPVDNGTYEVVDTAAGKVIDKIHTGGRPHNTLCSADGKRMYLAPMAKSARDNPKAVTIVDVATRKVIGTIDFSDAVRPVALSRDETRFYANLDNLIGLEVADVPSRKVIHRVVADMTDEQKKVKSRSHGIGIRPDQKELWTCDVNNHQVYVFDITAAVPRQIATIPMAGEVYWLTFSPDGKVCYVSVKGTNQVAAVDTDTKKILARIPSGEVPKRLIVVTPPGLAGMLAPGKRAFALKAKAASIVAGFITPGSRVDIVHRMPKATGKDRELTIILQNALVLAVDRVAEASMVTLEVTPPEAQQLAAAGEKGEFTLLLRPVGDDKKIPPPPKERK